MIGLSKKALGAIDIRVLANLKLPFIRMIQDSDTITLKDAAQHFGFSVWTLRAEADRGRLTIYKIGAAQ